MTSRCDGKVALISGAASGIGEATARLFVAEGARVALLGRRPRPLEDLATELGDSALAIPTDVSSPDAVAAAVRTTVEHFGGLDIVVASAGIAEPVPLRDLDPETWRRTIDIDLSGTFYLGREAGLWMLDHGGGTIINVSSGMANLGGAMLSAYCAAKAGVNGLTRALAIELAPTVRVNAVLPGPIDTPMIHKELAVFGIEASAVAAQLPMRRLGTSEEMAKGILYAAVDADYMSGAMLALDGASTIAH